MLKAVRGQERGEILPDDELTDETVSFDGTWPKRGHSSSSLSKLSSTCRLETFLTTKSTLKFVMCAGTMKYKDKTDEYKNWYKGHQPVCNKNTELSPRHKPGLKKCGSDLLPRIGCGIPRLLVMLTVSIPTVCDWKPLRDIDIRKEHCIGHVQKRMGNRLRMRMEWEKSSGKDEGRQISKGKGETN